MTTIFISDLHLSAETPTLTAHFLRFVEKEAGKAECLYILGDLFEAWIGDDNNEPFVKEIIQALAKLSQKTAIYIMNGNRDLLLGKHFAKACGATLLNDPTVIDLYGTKTLLTHGDLLCTDDIQYQRFRKITHFKPLQSLVLLLPLSLRRNIVRYLRKRSAQYVQTLPKKIMDVTQKGLERMLQKYPASWLIHGHTHNPSIRFTYINDKPLWHFVLSDWHKLGNALVCDLGIAPRLISLN